MAQPITNPQVINPLRADQPPQFLPQQPMVNYQQPIIPFNRHNNNDVQIAVKSAEKWAKIIFATSLILIVILILK